jgi:hypothetical protein
VAPAFATLCADNMSGTSEVPQLAAHFVERASRQRRHRMTAVSGKRLCTIDDCNSLHGRMVGLTVPLTLLTSATQVIELSSVYKVNT